MKRAVVVAAGALLLHAGISFGPALAQVNPGEMLGRNEAAKLRHLVSPGVLWVVNRGMTLKVVEAKPIPWPKAYREATEKYGGQVKLGSDGLTVENYVAGAPFPNIDVNDPQVALKIMWNYEYRPYPGTDDFVEFEFPVYSAALSPGQPMAVERQMLVGEVRRLYYNGRLYVDPKPEMKSRDDYRFKELLGPIVHPFDLKGLGALTFRYRSAARQDDTWLYMPTLRRVRRLSTAQRSDALFGQDTDPDSYWGYNGHIAWMSWKFLGVKKVLAVMHGEHFPMKQCEGAGDFTFCDSWELRDTYVIEGVSKLPQYAYGKRVIFIDKEGWVVAYSDIYDTRGELWKVWIDNHQFRKHAMKGGEQYDEEKDFYAGFTMVDTQLNHATYTPHPGPDVPPHDGWYFDAGASSKTRYNQAGSVDGAFTIDALISAGAG
ncbi:MAG: DUF1329 domain-containing protein [Candidatus Binatia bacterium]